MVLNNEDNILIENLYLFKNSDVKRTSDIRCSKLELRIDFDGI